MLWLSARYWAAAVFSVFCKVNKAYAVAVSPDFRRVHILSSVVAGLALTTAVWLSLRSTSVKLMVPVRSEERRVGKECTSWCTTEPLREQLVMLNASFVLVIVTVSVCVVEELWYA